MRMVAPPNTVQNVDRDRASCFALVMELTHMVGIVGLPSSKPSFDKLAPTALITEKLCGNVDVSLEEHGKLRLELTEIMILK
jgi:hypothetical protein